MDPLQGDKSAIEDQLEDAVVALGAFRVVKLDTAAVDESRRRVQQLTLGHRGRKGDPLYGIAKLLRAGAEKATDKQRASLGKPIAACPDEHLAVWIAWSSARQLRAAYRHRDQIEGRKIAEKVLDSIPTCPAPEIARLGRTLKRWRDSFLAYSPPAGRTTAAPKPTTGSSSSTAASPKASTTTTTTAYGCC
ncbi:MAG: transposase [Ornithinimicrobium sp.]